MYGYEVAWDVQSILIFDWDIQRADNPLYGERNLASSWLSMFLRQQSLNKKDFGDESVYRLIWSFVIEIIHAIRVSVNKHLCLVPYSDEKLKPL